MQKKLFVALLALGTMALAGCNKAPAPQPTYPDLDPALNGEMVADFSHGESEEIFASDGWSNGQPFNAVWKKNNVTYADGKMKLTIKDEKATAWDAEGHEVEYPYTAGEARSHKLYGYGDYLVSMKPSNVPGSVSTFFTYTGAGTVTDGVENSWNEIDIEFLGSNTRQVQFNYYENGRTKGHEYMYRLDFDASEDFHTYGFRWEENKISWVVDGKTVHQVTGTKASLPSQSGRIMASYWPSSADSWSGHYYHREGATSEYQWIKTSAQSRYADGEEPVAPVDDDINWDEIAETTINSFWTSSNVYTVNSQNGVHTVTYTESGNYSCIGSSDANAVANANNFVKFTLKNNSTVESEVKFVVQGNKVGDHDAINTSITAEGHSEVRTDTQWGGSFITVAPNEEVDVVVGYDTTTERGEVKNLMFFLDSNKAAVEAHEGNMTISKFKFAAVEESKTPDQYDWSVVPVVSYPIQGWSQNYTVTENNGAYTVTYTSAGGWACVGGNVKNYANDNNNTVKFTMKNNSTSETKVRVDVQAKTSPELETGTVVNKGAYAVDHSEVATPDGSNITLAANEEVDFYIAYEPTETTGPVENMVFFIDSMQEGTVTKADGSVTFKDFQFANLAAGGDDSGTEEPDPAVIPTEFDQNAMELTFGETGYDMAPAAGTATKYVVLSYANMTGGTYLTAEAPATPNASATSFSVTLTNYGKANSKVRVDVQGTTKVGNTQAINTSATAEGHTDIYTDTEWGGSTITLTPGEEVTFVITFSQTAERGAVTRVIFYADSCNYGDTNVYTGRVMFHNFIFA